MKLLTQSIYNQLLKNGHEKMAYHAAEDFAVEPDFFPVVKLFTPDAAGTWLLTELDPDEPDIAFGLCDLGLGCPELGYLSLSELQRFRGRLGLPVERDRFFVATPFPLAV